MAKQQKVSITIPGAMTPEIRTAVALEAIKVIRRRARGGSGVKDVGADGIGKSKTLPSYSKSYKGSLDFRNAGKSSKPNLKLSGDMLAAIEILNTKKGKVTIGFEAGSSENARAEGNQIGSYGKKFGSSRKARRFLGLTASELAQIIKKFPTETTEQREKSKEKAEERIATVEAASGEDT